MDTCPLYVLFKLDQNFTADGEDIRTGWNCTREKPGCDIWGKLVESSLVVSHFNWTLWSWCFGLLVFWRMNRWIEQRRMIDTNSFTSSANVHHNLSLFTLIHNKIQYNFDTCVSYDNNAYYTKWVIFNYK